MYVLPATYLYNCKVYWILLIVKQELKIPQVLIREHRLKGLVIATHTLFHALERRFSIQLRVYILEKIHDCSPSLITHPLVTYLTTYHRVRFFTYTPLSTYLRIHIIWRCLRTHAQEHIPGCKILNLHPWLHIIYSWENMWVYKYKDKPFSARPWGRPQGTFQHGAPLLTHLDDPRCVCQH